MKHCSIHWFRKGLRLHDNPALLAAMTDCCELYPVFILDPWFPKNMRVSVNRWRFLVESLRDLDESLQKLNSRLFVVRGCPAEIFPGLFKAWKVTRLTFEVDTEPYSRQRDAEVARLAAEHGVQVIQKVSNTLYDTDRVIAENNDKAPLTYVRLQTLLVSLGPPERPMPAPTLENLKDCCTPCKDNHDAEFGIPTLEELGQDPEQAGPRLYPGGESEALGRLDLHMNRTSWVCNFQKPHTEPNSLSPSTTVLSPYIKFGCLSVRTFWWKLAEIYQGRKHSSPPVSLHGQLLWREFFYTAGAGIPNFSRMEGNPVCVQVDWDDHPEHLRAWSEGRTGYPFIDAIMTQLRTEGWIHHLARHAVACFLTRGDLWISWEEGQKVRHVTRGSAEMGGTRTLAFVEGQTGWHLQSKLAAPLSCRQESLESSPQLSPRPADEQTAGAGGGDPTTTANSWSVMQRGARLALEQLGTGLRISLPTPVQLPHLRLWQWELHRGLWCRCRRGDQACPGAAELDLHGHGCPRW